MIPEEWGGDTPFIPVSAKVGTGVDELLEAVLLQAEILELKATPSAPGRGVVVESRPTGAWRSPPSRFRTVRCAVAIWSVWCELRPRTGHARREWQAGEGSRSGHSGGDSGLDGTPEAGDDLTVVADEKKAREVALFRQGKFREVKLARARRPSGREEDAQHRAQGRRAWFARSAARVAQRPGNDEVQVRVVGGGVGGITESDANLALASNAVLFGFNVRADAGARKIVEAEGPDMRYYNVIYDIIEDVKKALTGMLGSDVRENILGIAEVRDVFRSPKFGAIAGCMVTEGMVHRNRPIRVLRDDVVIFEGELESLRRFKR